MFHSLGAQKLGRPATITERSTHDGSPHSAREDAHNCITVSFLEASGTASPALFVSLLNAALSLRDAASYGYIQKTKYNLVTRVKPATMDEVHLGV